MFCSLHCGCLHLPQISIASALENCSIFQLVGSSIALSQSTHSLRPALYCRHLLRLRLRPSSAPSPHHVPNWRRRGTLRGLHAFKEAVLKHLRRAAATHPAGLLAGLAALSAAAAAATAVRQRRRTGVEAVMYVVFVLPDRRATGLGLVPYCGCGRGCGCGCVRTGWSSFVSHPSGAALSAPRAVTGRPVPLQTV